MLVLTPPPQPSESLLGYVLRVSETNGYDTPWHVMTHAGMEQGEMRTAGLSVRKLSAIVGHPVANLARLAYVRDVHGERRFKLLDNDLGGSLNERPLRLDVPRLCPHCVQSSEYIDAFWDLSIAIACPHHGCEAVASCPSCGSALSWFRPGLLTCRCGAKLQDVKPAPVSPALRGLMAVVWAVVHKGDIPTENAVGLPLADLCGLRLPALLWTLDSLGRFNRKSKAEPETSDSRLQMESAAEVLADWPIGYHRFLDRLGQSFTTEGPTTAGLRKQFEPFYAVLFKSKSYKDDVAFLRDEFVRFGSTKWDKAAFDVKLLRGSAGVEPRFGSRAKAARKTGVRPITLRRWSEKGLLPMKPVEISGQRRYIVDAESVGLVKQLPGRTFETRKAAAFVGLPVSVLMGLKASGHYRCESMPKQKHGFHELDLTSLRQRLLDASEVIEPSALERDATVTFQHVLKNWKFVLENGKTEFVAAYLEGRIQSLGRTGDAWDAIHFRKAEVEAVVLKNRISAAANASSVQPCQP